MYKFVAYHIAIIYFDRKYVEVDTRNFEKKSVIYDIDKIEITLINISIH